MPVILVAVCMLLALFQSAHAEDDAMEAQRCIWRCLANSKGADDPAYSACIAEKCDGPSENQSAARKWEPSPHDGEKRRSVIGCSDGTNDENWTCLIVRCDDGDLNVYFDGTNAGRLEGISLEIDGRQFPVSQGDPAGSPFKERFLGDSRGIVEAMKAGSRVRIVGAEMWLNPGFDTIPLRGSSKAIGRLERSCRR